MMEAKQETRRQALAMLAGLTGALFSAPFSAPAQTRAPTPQPMPSPNAPANQNIPAGLENAGVGRGGKQGIISPLMWTEIKTDSDRLLQMAADFKSKVDQTNLADTLSLPLIKQAHEIEKMAKAIQQRMRA